MMIGEYNVPSTDSEDRRGGSTAIVGEEDISSHMGGGMTWQWNISRRGVHVHSTGEHT